MLVDRIAELSPYARIDDPTTARRLGRPLQDPTALVRHVGEQLHTDDPMVAASVAFLTVTNRAALPLALANAALDLHLAPPFGAVRWRVADGMVRLGFADDRTGPAVPWARWAAQFVADVVEPWVELMAASARIGRRLLWGNAAASLLAAAERVAVITSCSAGEALALAEEVVGRTAAHGLGGGRGGGFGVVRLPAHGPAACSSRPPAPAAAATAASTRAGRRASWPLGCCDHSTSTSPTVLAHSLEPDAGAWTMGVVGAIAEHVVDASTTFREVEGGVEAVGATGALRLVPGPDAQVLAAEAAGQRRRPSVLVLATPRGGAAGPGLVTRRGPDAGRDPPGGPRRRTGRSRPRPPSRSLPGSQSRPGGARLPRRASRGDRGRTPRTPTSSCSWLARLTAS